MKISYSSAVNGVVALTILFLLCGCGTVYSPVPVGEPVDLSGEVEKWEGIWMQDGEASFKVKVLDAERGLLRITSVDPEEDEVMDLLITGHGDWMFANLPHNWEEKNVKATEAERYIWGRLVKDNHTALVWVPDDGKFVELVKAGVLPGTVDARGSTRPITPSDVHLDPLNADHLDRIASETNGLLFIWHSPMVFMKMAHPSGSEAEKPDAVATNATPSLEVLSILPDE